MNKPILMLTLLLAGLLLLAGCANNSTPSAGSVASAPAATVSSVAGNGVTGTGAATGATNVQTITVTAANFEFTPGTETPITLKKGVPVKLLITATDVGHGISIPDLGISQNLPVGQQVEVDFTPDKAGNFSFRCNVFCGEGHRGMKGTIVVTD